MDATCLKAMQAPLKDRYREDAGTALVTLGARGSFAEEGIACKVKPGWHSP